ncbi:hypothetical protein, partial [Chryseobacterium hagamense]|uniref:hypothetical protein n=1 Tax=Chryseobacterium hagamense TaxID=395935 RepID=UPI001E4358B5
LNPAVVIRIQRKIHHLPLNIHFKTTPPKILLIFATLQFRGILIKDIYLDFGLGCNRREELNKMIQFSLETNIER